MNNRKVSSEAGNKPGGGKVSGNQLTLDAVEKAFPGNSKASKRKSTGENNPFAPSDEILQYVDYPSDSRFFEVFMTEHKVLNQRLEVEPEVFIEYDVFGPNSAPDKVIMLMGLLAYRIDYSITVNTILAKHPERFQIVVLDNRGIGGSSSPNMNYTTKMMAEDAFKIVESLKWDKFHVAGISMGGMISQQLALLAKDRVRSLTLLVTHAGGPLARPAAAQLYGYWNLAKMMWFNNTPEGVVDATIKNLYSDKFVQQSADDKTGRLHEEQKRHAGLAKLKYLEDKQKLVTPHGKNGQLSAAKTHRVEDEVLRSLLQYQYPILLVGATKDRLVHHRNSAHIYQVLKSSSLVQYIELESGHGVLGEEIDLVADAMVETMLKATSTTSN